MLQTTDKKACDKTIISFNTLNGAALVTDEGKEVPITQPMIEKALRTLEQE